MRGLKQEPYSAVIMKNIEQEAAGYVFLLFLHNQPFHYFDSSFMNFEVKSKSMELKGAIFAPAYAQEKS